MESNYLKYGSLITLSTSEGFYLYSQGFVESSPYLREQKHGFSDFSNSVFRILPQCMHSVQTNILEYIKDIREVDYKDKKPHLLKMEENLEGEINSNIHTYNTLKGEIIKYNSLIQLEHLTSHKYLTLNSQVNADTEKDNFKLTFEDFPSEHSHFRIVPSYNFQKYGSGNIKIFDKVFLEIIVPGIRKIAWIHGSKANSIDMVLSSVCGDLATNVLCKAIEVNVSLDQKTRWSIGIYGDLQKDTKHLACGDYVWLTMPEEDLTLTVYKKRWEKEKNTLIFTHNPNDSNGLWMVEYEDAFKGGPVTVNKRYRFKHIITGKYLTIKENLKLKNRPTSSTLWKFITLHSEEFIKSDQLCHIVHDKSNQFIQVAPNEKICVSPHINEIFVFKTSKANSEIVWEILFLLHSYPILINFPSKIEEFQDIEDRKKILEFNKQCDLLINCLNNLQLFCRNELQSMIGIDNHFGEVQYIRQVMLKKQHFFEALAKILEVVLKEDQYEKIKKVVIGNDRVHRYSKNDADLETVKLRKVKKIITQIYSLLITICDKNAETQAYAYKFLNVYIKHTGLDLEATDFILSILRNNEKLMLGLKDNEEIDIICNYTSLLSSVKSIEVLDFLKSICVFKGEGVSVNQEKVFALIFKNKNLKKKIIITKPKNDTLKIALDHPKITLTSCFEDGRIIGHHASIQYYISLLELYSNLCKGRNFESANLFMPQFPFHIIHSMIWNSDLTISIRAAFCQLMLNIYIDCFMREEVTKPELIKFICVDEKIMMPERSQTIYNYEASSSGQPSNLINSPHYKAYQESQRSLPELIKKIFDYFESEFGKKKIENVLTYELLEVVFKLIKFEAFEIELSDDDSYQSDSQKENCFVHIMRCIMPMLLEVKDNQQKNDVNIVRKRVSLREVKVSNDSEISHTHYLSSILKDSNSLDDPIIRSAANLKNFLNSYRQNPFKCLEKKSIEHKIKLRLCKIIEYFLDTRQEFLINNTIEWFKSIGENKTWKTSDLQKLLPDVLHVSNLGAKGNDSNFKCYLEAMFPSIDNLYPIPIIPALLRTFIYSDNYVLKTKVILIILRTYKQRKEMIKNIKKLHIIFKSADISLLDWIKSSLLSFKHHAEQSELWLDYSSASPSMQIKHKSVFPTMQKILTEIKNFLYKDTFLTQNGPSEPTEKIISQDRQEMLCYSNVHTLIITLIKDGLFKLAEIYFPNNHSEQCLLLIDLFTNCFKFLKNFVNNNPRNQKKVSKFIHIINQYLYIPLGQIDLICEVYRNNLNLISEINESMLLQFSDLIIKYGRQSEFLKFFEVVQIIKKGEQVRPVPFMQRTVLSLFINEKINNFLLYMNENEKPEFIFEEVPNENVFYCDQPFKYHSTLLKVLSACGLGVTSVVLNEVKCQNLISLQNIFKILNLNDLDNEFYFEMKLAMLDFFYNIYLDCEIINLDLKSSNDFFDYIYSQSNFLHDIERVDENYLEFLKIFIKILTKYRTSYIKQSFSSYYEQEDIKAIRSFVEAILKNTQKFNIKSISSSLFDAISDLCELFNEEFEIHNNLSESDCIYDSPLLIHKHTLVDKESETSAELEKWRSIRDSFTKDPVFKKMIDDEEFALIFIFNNCSEIDFEKIVSSLISYIALSRSQKPSVHIQLLVIEILQKILERPSFDKVLKESEVKANMQKKLSYCGLTNTILNLMMDSQIEKNIFHALISLSIHLLEGGNPLIQEEFYQHFLTTSNSEFFFRRIFEFFKTKIEQIPESGIGDIKPSLVYKDKQNSIKNLLRFLQLLCENHNLKLQNYLRCQENSHISYNLIEIIISLLEILLQKRERNAFLIISQCFETLTEMIQGPCLQNQEEIINSNFVEIASFLLSIDENSDNATVYEIFQTKEISNDPFKDEENYVLLSGWMISHLKFKCLITISSLYEGRKDTVIITRLIRSLNLEVLKENLKSIYVNYNCKYEANYYDKEIFNNFIENDDYDFGISSNKQDLRPKDYILIIENGFLIFILLKTLLENEDIENGDVNNELLGLLKLEEEFEACENDLGIRELIREKRYSGFTKFHNEKIINSSYKFFYSHTGNIEIVFQEKIFRVYFSFPPEYKGLTKEIKNNFHRKAIRESDQSKLKYLLDQSKNIRKVIKHEYEVQKIMKKSRTINIIFKNIELWRIFAFLLTLLLNFIILTSFTYNRSSESFLTFNPDDKGIGSYKTVALLKLFGIIQLVCCLLIVAFFLIKVGPLLAKKGWKKNKPTDDFLKSNPGVLMLYTVKAIQLFTTIFYVLSNIDVLYYLLYTVFSILGIFVHPFYFSLLLLDIVYRYPALQNVVNSIYLPSKALLLVLLLFMVIIFLYAIVAYWLLEDDFSPNCKSLMQCYFTVWDKSFKYDGGIGGFLGSPLTPTYSSLRFFYDNIFNILVTIVLMGVIQGIIIDTFARLRETQEASTRDRKNKCFICGFQRDYIEKKSVKGFVNHIENEHSEWNYILFLSYLLSKESTEYTGFESFVKEQFDKEELSWIPNKAALNIKDSNEEEQMLDMVKSISEKIKKIKIEGKESRNK